ncbi:Fanconi anemia group J protein, partial [Biomphalaria glabrata]
IESRDRAFIKLNFHVTSESKDRSSSRSILRMHTEYKISGISVYFPCKPYPSQFTMMDKIIKGLDRRQNCLLESPTGSGKSLALLCSSLAWQAAEKEKRDKEDDEEIQRANCICSCHSQATANTEKKSSLIDLTQPEPSNMCLEIDNDDFKMNATKFNIPASKKNPLKHVSIAYEEDKSEDNGLQKILQTVDAILGVKKVEDVKSVAAPECHQCLQCPCDSPEGKSKVKNKLSKIYFGTRTHKQVAQIVRELKKTKYHDVKMTVLGSREHTCIHPDVSRMKAKNDGCKELLNGPGCRFKDGTNRLLSQSVLKSAGLSSAWDIEDLVQLCQKKKACPYFLSRGLKDDSDLIICPYNYLVDPIVREAMAISLKGHIVILDEAHNIEDAAREAASQSISQDSIEKAISDIDELIEKNINFADYSRLRAVFFRLNNFINENKSKMEQKDFDKAYKIWSAFEIVAQLDSLGLGPKHFPDLKSAFSAVKADAEQRKEEASNSTRFIEVVDMKPATEGLLTQIFQVLEYLYRSDLKYVDDFRASLVQSYEYVFTHQDNQWLNSKKGGNQSRKATETYTFNFWCMNPGVAFSDFSETRSIILTSGTLSPLTSFQSELGLNFSIQLEANHVIKDSQVWVGTIGAGPSGNKLQAVFRNLETFAFQDELGGLVLKVCEIVPHGVLCFLPSYKVLEKLMNRWENIGLLKKLASKKKIIVEPRGSDKVDFEGQMLSFYEALRSGSSDSTDDEDEEGDSVTGAIFFAVCRGKVSEGLDFADNFARAVITVGIPYPNFKDVQVEQKRNYNETHKHSRGLLGGHQWYEIQAFRALNQALGRCIRHRNDWGALIIVDERFVRDPQKYCTGLSKWVRTKIQSHHNFALAMDSLTQFIATRVSADKETSANSSMLEASNISSPLREVPVNHTVCASVTTPTPVTAQQLSLPDKSNFSIFSVMKPFPAKYKQPSKESSKVNVSSQGDTNSITSKVNGLSCFMPNQKHVHPIHSLQSPKLSGAAGCSREAPVVIDSDTSHKEALSNNSSHSIETSHINNNTLPSKTSNNVDNETAKQVSLTPAYILEKKIDTSDIVQLCIITEKATNGETAKVVEIPEILRSLFGGNLRLPLSNKQRLVYIVEPPTSLGQRPTAKISKISEEETQSLVDKAKAAESMPCEDVSSIRDKSLSASTSDLAKKLYLQDPAINSTVSYSPSQKNVNSISKSQVYSAIKLATVPLSLISSAVTSSFENSPNKIQISTESIESSQSHLIGAISKINASNGLDNSSPNQVKSNPIVHQPTSASFAESPRVLPRNKRRLFKTRIVPVLGQDKPEEISQLPKPQKSNNSNTAIDSNISILHKPENKSTSEATPQKSKSKPTAEASPKTPGTSPLSSFVEDPDEENFEKEHIVIRRKTKKRKISLRHSAKKKPKEEGANYICSTKTQSCKMSFRCSTCSHVIFHEKAPSDFYQQQCMPTFLRDKSMTGNIGCYFFPSNTSLEGLVTQVTNSPGISTKYIEQEEICIQYLYCAHCFSQAPDTVPHFLGAQVQLAAAAEARYSKGQMWLLENCVQIEHLALNKEIDKSS